MSPTDEPTLRGGQYLRVSVDRTGRARSNDEQKCDNERDAAALSATIVRSYADPDRSASRYATKAREKYAELLRDIDRGELDILWLWESSRGSRKVSEWVTLIELCEERTVKIRVTTHGRTYDPANPRDRRSLLEDAVDSEYESGKTSVRVRRGTAAGAEAGRPHGMVPYGYMREYDPHTGRLAQQVPDPATKPVVEEIVKRVLRGDPALTIADDLTVRGVPTPAQYRAARRGLEVPDASWSRRTINWLFSSPTRIGLRTHNGVIVGSADWDPIISPADFEAAERALRSPLLHLNPGSAARHLLSGIAICGVCDARCNRQINHGVPSYSCAGLPPAPGQPRPSRKHVARSQERVDAMVTAAVVQRMSRPDARELLATERQDVQAAEAARELVDLQATLRVLEEQVAKAPNPRSVAVFAKQVNQLTARITVLEPKAESESVPQAVFDLIGEDAAARWELMPLLRRRQAVRALLDVVIHRSPRPKGSKVFDPSSVELRWRVV